MVIYEVGSFTREPAMAASSRVEVNFTLASYDRDVEQSGTPPVGDRSRSALVSRVTTLSVSQRTAPAYVGSHGINKYACQLKCDCPSEQKLVK